MDEKDEMKLEEAYTLDTAVPPVPDEGVQHEMAMEIAKKIAVILDSKKAMDVKILDVRDKTIIADFFVFATGTSTTQVNSLADEVDFRLSGEGIETLRSEGRGSGSWVLLDYGSVIVHVFGKASKDFYKLDKLWAEGVEVPFDKIPDAE